jgi:hypothetical protein
MFLQYSKVVLSAVLQLSICIINNYYWVHPRSAAEMGRAINPIHILQKTSNRIRILNSHTIIREYHPQRRESVCHQSSSALLLFPFAQSTQKMTAVRLRHSLLFRLIIIIIIFFFFFSKQ